MKRKLTNYGQKDPNTVMNFVTEPDDVWRYSYLLADCFFYRHPRKTYDVLVDTPPPYQPITWLQLGKNTWESFKDYVREACRPDMLDKDRWPDDATRPKRWTAALAEANVASKDYLIGLFWTENEPIKEEGLLEPDNESHEMTYSEWTYDVITKVRHDVAAIFWTEEDVLEDVDKPAVVQDDPQTTSWYQRCKDMVGAIQYHVTALLPDLGLLSGENNKGGTDDVITLDQNAPKQVVAFGKTWYGRTMDSLMSLLSSRGNPSSHQDYKVMSVPTDDVTAFGNKDPKPKEPSTKPWYKRSEDVFATVMDYVTSWLPSGVTKSRDVKYKDSILRSDDAGIIKHHVDGKVHNAGVWHGRDRKGSVMDWMTSFLTDLGGGSSDEDHKVTTVYSDDADAAKHDDPQDAIPLKKPCMAWFSRDEVYKMVTSVLWLDAGSEPGVD